MNGNMSNMLRYLQYVRYVRYAPGVRYLDPLYMAQVRVDTSGGRGFVVDMVEYGDTLEKIAADEIARLQQIPEVMKLFPDKATAKARGEKMLEQLDKEIFGPANATKGLVPQPQPADAGGDNSDEEQDLATAILAGQAW